MIKFRILLLACNLFLVSGATFAKGGTKIQNDTIYVTGHAHMDMNWMWTHSETRKMAQDNLRQAVALLKEYPDFRMLQSEAAVYHFVEETDQPLFKEVQEMVRQGRLEPVGGMWVESDQNLPSGEAFSRSLLFGQHYFREKFGRICTIGWLPDDFGHIAQLPQILRLAGMDSYYFMRCPPYKGAFWWVGPDKSQVLCYTGGSYTGKTDRKFLTDDFQKYGQFGRLYKPIGIGDHGGGPTRKDIANIHRLDADTSFASVKFTTARNFFDRIRVDSARYPVHTGEMQYIFEGCYTNVAELKALNRQCENALYKGEYLSVLDFLNGGKYPQQTLHDTWQHVVFNQFHDILPGSAIYESNRESVSRYSEALRKVEELTEKTFRNIADGVKNQKNLGQPVFAYNFQPFEHRALITADVYTNKLPATVKVPTFHHFYDCVRVTPKDMGQGPVASIMVRDASGKSFPAQIISAKGTPPGYTLKIAFVDDNMIAGGYRTYYVDATQPGACNDTIPFDGRSFETDFYKIGIDPASGDITSLIEKKTGKEYVTSGKKLNTLRIFKEDKNGEMASWVINKINSTEDIVETVGKPRIENGPVQVCIESIRKWHNSRFVIRTHIYKNYPRIDYDVEAHWLETCGDSHWRNWGGEDNDSPMLRAIFPIDVKNGKFCNMVPFDVVERPADGMLAGKAMPDYLNRRADEPKTAEANDGQEVPAQKWVDVSDGKNGIALMNRSKYGYSYQNGELRLTLLRSGGYPDMYPNLGKSHIEYSLYPHEGDWTNGVMAEGESYNLPVLAAEPPSLSMDSRPRTLKEEESLLKIDRSNVLLSALKKAEDGDEIILRLCEMKGEASELNLSLPGKILAVRPVSLIEDPLPKMKYRLKGNQLRLKIGAHQILSLAIQMDTKR